MVADLIYCIHERRFLLALDERWVLTLDPAGDPLCSKQSIAFLIQMLLHFSKRGIYMYFFAMYLFDFTSVP